MKAMLSTMLLCVLMLPFVSSDVSHAMCNIASELVFPDYIHGWKCNPNEAFPTVDQVCEWSGVTCANNQVVAISIGNMGVEGTLSPWLGTLLHLVNLNIYGNYIKGTIPLELGGLKNLQMFSFFGNLLEGSIPDRVCNQAKLRGFYPCYPDVNGEVTPDACGALTAVPQCLRQNKLQFLQEARIWTGNLVSV